MKYKYILFDWDGCLARTLDVWLDSYKQTLKELGIKKTGKEITSVFGDWQGGDKLGAPDNDKFFERVDELVKDKMPKVGLHEGAGEVVKKLKMNGCTLAILSSSLREYLIPAMKHHGIFDSFELIITGEDVKKHKPDPEVINKAIKKLGGDKKEYVIIGDSDKDVFAAKNTGIDSILYYPDEHELYYDLDILMESQPTFLAHNFRQMYKFLI